MKWHKLEALVFSDVHTGHSTTPTENILKRMKEAVQTSVKKNGCQFIFIPGDFFDSLLNLPANASREIIQFINWFLKYCKRNSIKLRILEGTPSHDWKQNYLFQKLNDKGEIDADVRYYDKLSIDYEEEYNLHILYVPDEWDEDPLETQRQVQALLDERGLKEVDLAMMHGMFHFQMPKNIQLGLPMHDQTYYESIVKSLIVIGHDHRHKKNGKVVVPGSFDRLAHGEEDPKGHLEFTLKADGKVNLRFIENEEAEIYQSIELSNDNDVVVTLKEIDRRVATLPDNAKVRLILDENNPVITYLRNLANTYPLLVWSKPKVIRAEKKVELQEVLEVNYTAVILNENNIEEKLINHALKRNSTLDVALAKRLMQEVIKYAGSNT